MNGSRNGYGTMRDRDGSKYEGYWDHHLKKGKGKHTYPDGDTEEGEYYIDRHVGEHIYKSIKTGKEYKRLYKDGEIISTQEIK